MSSVYKEVVTEPSPGMLSKTLTRFFSRFCTFAMPIEGPQFRGQESEWGQFTKAFMSMGSNTRGVFFYMPLGIGPEASSSLFLKVH